MAEQPAARIVAEEGALQRQIASRVTQNQLQTLLECVNVVFDRRLNDFVNENVERMTEQQMWEHWQARSSVPYGSLRQIAQQFRTTLNVRSTDQQVRNLLNNNNVNQLQIWNNLVDTTLHERYVAATANIIGQGAAEGAGQADAGEEEDEENDRYRATPPISFTHLVRNELDENALFEKVQEAAKRVTMAVSNTSAIVKATMCRIAQTNIDLDGQVCTLEEEEVGFEVAAIFPQGFAIRNDSMLDHRGRVNIAIPNHDLKEDLQEQFPANTSAKDLKDMFSFSHISFIHGQHFGVRTEQDGGTGHGLWRELIFADTDIPRTVSGISTTVNQALRRYSTNLSNMWQDQSIFEKSLEYVVRILLRLHLAPRREARNMARAQQRRDQAAARREERQNHPSQQSPKQIQQRMKHEQREIARHVLVAQQIPNLTATSAQRIQSCIRRLDSLTTSLEELNAGPPGSTESALSRRPTESIDIDVAQYADYLNDQDVEGENDIETPATRINSIKGGVKAILRSSHIPRDQPVDEQTIRSQSRTRDLTAREINAIQTIIDALLPYVPNNDSHHLLTDLPFVLLSNTILCSAGYAKFMQSIHPDVKPSSIHVLHMNPSTIYEIFTPHRYGQPQGDYQMILPRQGQQPAPITSLTTARDHPEAVISSFFRADQIANICREFHLDFQNSLAVSADKTVRILGELQEPHQPVISTFERRQRERRRRRQPREPRPSVAGDLQHLRQEQGQLQQALQQQEQSLPQLEREIRVSTEHFEQAKQFTLTCEKGDRLSARLRAQTCRKNLRRQIYAKSILKQSITDKKRRLYALSNGIEDAERGNAPVPPEPPPRISVSPQRPLYEDDSDRIELDQFDRDLQAFGCTDYGHVNMVTTQALTYEQVSTHVNLYNAEFAGTPPVELSHDETILKRPFTITNEHIHEVTNTRSLLQKMQKRKRSKQEVLDAERALFENAYGQCFNPRDIIIKQSVRLNHREQLQSFYYNNANMNESRHQSLRKDRVFAQVAKKEREFVKNSVAKRMGVSKKHLNVSMAIGKAGTGVRSFLRGRPRYGGKKLRNNHRQACPVLLQNEHNSSRRCVFCFSPLYSPPGCHGALICMNENCVAVRNGHATFGRDASAAIAIGIAAITTLYSERRRPLPPYDPRCHHETPERFILENENNLLHPPSPLEGASVASVVIPGRDSISEGEPPQAGSDSSQSDPS